MKKNKQFKVGDKVFAKVKGYPPWPAVVVNDQGKKFSVQFYGTGEMGYIKPEDLFHYIKHKNQFAKASKKKEFNDALIEIEQEILKDGGAPEDADNNESSNVDNNQKNLHNEDKKNLKRKRSQSSSEKSVDELQPPSKIEKNPNEETISQNLEIENNEETKNSKCIIESEVANGDTEPIDEDKPTVEKPNFNLVFENDLLANLVYAEHVEKDPETYKNKPVEDRNYSVNQVFPVMLDDKYVALKLHLNWPIEFSNEYECAKYDEKVSNRLLDQSNLVKSKKINPERFPELFAKDFNLSESEVTGEFELKKINKKYKIIERLRSETSLVDLDTKIQNCLTLDRANTKNALIYLDEMLKIPVDHLMLKKHPHVVEMIRRLRKYVGNLEEWNLDKKATEIFLQDAKQIREKAEIVVEKFKKVMNFKIDDGSTFFDTFYKAAEEFSKKCQHLSNEQIFVLCAEPDTRKAILDIQDQKVYIEHQKDKKISDGEKENQSDVINFDTN